MRAYTFVCIRENQDAVTVDVQALADEAFRAHALQLLRDHASVATTEIWYDEAVFDSLARDGVHPWPRRACSRLPRSSGQRQRSAVRMKTNAGRSWPPNSQANST